MLKCSTATVRPPVRDETRRGGRAPERAICAPYQESTAEVGKCVVPARSRIFRELMFRASFWRAASEVIALSDNVSFIASPTLLDRDVSSPRDRVSVPVGRSLGQEFRVGGCADRSYWRAGQGEFCACDRRLVRPGIRADCVTLAGLAGLLVF